MSIFLRAGSKSRRQKKRELCLCDTCGKVVRTDKKHRCVTPFVASPPHGYRWQNNRLVGRHA